MARDLQAVVWSAATEFEAGWRRLQNDLQAQGAFLLSLDAGQLPQILQVLPLAALFGTGDQLCGANFAQLSEVHAGCRRKMSVLQLLPLSAAGQVAVSARSCRPRQVQAQLQCACTGARFWKRACNSR